MWRDLEHVICELLAMAADSVPYSRRKAEGIPECINSFVRSIQQIDSGHSRLKKRRECCEHKQDGALNPGTCHFVMTHELLTVLMRSEARGLAMKRCVCVIGRTRFTYCAERDADGAFADWPMPLEGFMGAERPSMRPYPRMTSTFCHAFSNACTYSACS